MINNMGMFDEFLDDVKAIRKELADTKKVVTSSFSELTNDIVGIQKDVRNTIDEVKSEAAKASQDIKDSLSLNPNKTPSKSSSKKPDIEPSQPGKSGEIMDVTHKNPPKT